MKAMPQIAQRMPLVIKDYREPFVGGGAVALYVLARYPEATVWINDLNEEVYLFWLCSRDQNKQLIAGIWELKAKYQDGKALYDYLKEEKERTDLERAIRFFVLNRITYSGTADSGGYSRHAFHFRFTPRSINKVAGLGPLLKGVKITNLDYSEVIEPDGEDVFVFLDPPYRDATKSALYGTAGDLHKGFDHDLFAEKVKACPHFWLITYDNNKANREAFEDYYQEKWRLKYAMTNTGGNKTRTATELFISNGRFVRLFPNLSI